MIKVLKQYYFHMVKIRITSTLVAENMALRQQLAVMKRTNKRPKIKAVDRIFWILLSRIWSPWQKSLVIVQPDTVVCWHKRGLNIFGKLSEGDDLNQIWKSVIVPKRWLYLIKAMVHQESMVNCACNPVISEIFPLKLLYFCDESHSHSRTEKHKKHF